MVYKKIQNEKGNYIDKMNVRYDILQAHEAWTPQGKNAGWESFATQASCLGAWGLRYDPLPGGEADGAN